MNKATMVLVVSAGLLAAFAFRPSEVLNFEYGISSENSSGWVVQAVITAETEGVGYYCGEARTDDCTVESNTLYAVGQTIPYSNGISSGVQREFIDLP